MEYDLRFKPWINVEFLNGSKDKVGLQKLFEQAHEIRSFYHDNPLAEAALMRILIALSHRILDGPKDKKSWKEAFKAGGYDAKLVKSYFDHWADRFDLFHWKYPFMQVTNLTMTDNKTQLPLLDLLIHDIATGNNATLFDHSLDHKPHIYTPDEAVYVLLVAIFFSLGGTHKKSTNLCGYQSNCKHCVGVNGVYAYVLGETLFETLMLNTLVLGNDTPLSMLQDDRPFWEAPDNSCIETMPKGYLDYLTMTGRLIRLVAQDDGMVERVHFACGRALQASLKDPFVPTKIENNQEKSLNASLERSLWRDSDALFRYSSEGFTIAPLRQLANMSRSMRNRAYRFVVYGLINDKANPQGYLKAQLPIPLALLENPGLRERISQVIDMAEKGYKKLYGALKSFSQSTEISMDQLKHIAASNYWGDLELPFRAFFNTIETDDAIHRWRKSVQKTIFEAFDISTQPLIGGKARLIEAYTQAREKLYLQKGGES